MKASSAPSAYSASLIAQAMLRSLATPITRPILPANMPMSLRIEIQRCRICSELNAIARIEYSNI